MYHSRIGLLIHRTPCSQLYRLFLLSPCSSLREAYPSRFFLFWITRNNKAPTFVEALSWNMVPVGGLEPPRPKATDFESVVYTNFTTPASRGYCPLMVGIIRKLLTCASRKTLNNYRLLIISPQSVTKKISSQFSLPYHLITRPPSQPYKRLTVISET